MSAVGQTDCPSSVFQVAVSAGLANTNGSASLPAPIPHQPALGSSLIGLRFSVLDTAAIPLGVGVTPPRLDLECLVIGSLLSCRQACEDRSDTAQRHPLALESQ